MPAHIVVRGQAPLYEENKQVRSRLQELHTLQPWRAVGWILLDWGMIAAAIAVALIVANPLLTFMCMIVIAGRQHALIVLMHDGAHGSILRNRQWGERLANLTCAWPTLVDTGTYRQSHRDHHTLTNRPDDPDIARRLYQKAWQFPKSWQDHGRELIASVLLGPWSQWQVARHIGVANRRNRGALFFVLAIQLILVAAIPNAWQALALYWGSLFLILPVLFRWRSIAEHFGLPCTNYLNGSRNVYAGFIERSLFGPHNVNLHLTHHLYPGIPFYNLPSADEYLRSNVPEYGELGHFSQGYWLGGSRSTLAETTQNTGPVDRAVLPIS